MTGRQLVALLVLLPALAGACAVTVGEGMALRSARRSADTPASSFADALKNSDLDTAMFHVRRTRDVNAPIEFSDAVLTDDRRIRVAPLMIAVASNKEDSVTMLLGAGATLDPHRHALARCLSIRLGHEKIVRVLERYAGPFDREVSCPESAQMRSAPLVWFASAAQQ